MRYVNDINPLTKQQMNELIEETTSPADEVERSAKKAGMSVPQYKHGQSIIAEMMQRYKITEEQAVNILDDIHALQDHFEWYNMDRYLLHKTSMLKRDWWHYKLAGCKSCSKINTLKWKDARRVETVTYTGVESTWADIDCDYCDNIMQVFK